MATTRPGRIPAVSVSRPGLLGSSTSPAMESGLGIGIGIGVGAWAQANTQTVIPIVEPRLVFVNGELLVPGR